MYQYGNLSDFEFELLCRDIMERKIGCPLRCFAPGRDGGVDITETRLSGCHMVQVKHYIDSSYSTLLSSLKKELPKVKQKQPKHYYVCCGKKADGTEYFRDLSAFFGLYGRCGSGCGSDGD